MTSATLERVEPAYLWVPPHSSSASVEVCQFGEQIGMVPDPEQRLVIDAVMAENEVGEHAAFEAGVACARQNLKTFVYRLIVLHAIYVLDVELAVWTAHQFDVTQEAFRDLELVIENYDHLRQRVKRTSKANGDEGFELFGGQRIKFKARTKTGGRGLTAPLVVLDEAQELTTPMMGSIMPAMSAVRDPQLLYGGSAGKVASAVWRRVRDRGRGGGDPSLVWVEFCAPVTKCELPSCDHAPLTPGCALDDRGLWKLANPAMGRRIKESHIEAERRSLAPEEFARERLGWWDEPSSTIGGVDLELWESRRALSEAGDPVVAMASEPVGFAVDVTPDSSYASIAAAYDVPDGRVVAVVEHHRGTDWVADKLKDRLGDVVRPVAVDKAGPASVVLPDLEREDIEVVSPTGPEFTAACAAFIDGLARGTIFHLGQPDLDAAVRGAVRAPSGDGWKWSRKSSAIDISPLVSATFASFAADQPVEGEPDFFVI